MKSLSKSFGGLLHEMNEIFTSSLTVTATRDRSESAAAQFVAARPRILALNPSGLLTFPTPNDARRADWTPTVYGTNERFPYAGDTKLVDASWRNELELTWMGVGKGVPKPIAEAYWRMKNGVSRRLKDMMPK